MLEEFGSYNITEVNPGVGCGKNKSIASGFSRMLDIGTKNQDIHKPFQPFILLEDDATKYREFPESLEIPDDADILFIGLSICGMQKDTHCNKVCYKTINDDIIKISNMLSGHGIVICSIKGLLACQKCNDEAFFTDKIWDIFFAQIQPYYNVYALRKPLVYQSLEYGGCEHATKIEYNDGINVEMDEEWINKNNFSIITIV